MSLFNKKKKTHSIGKIIVSEKSTDSKCEGYNKLRDNIMFINSASGAKVIQIESSVAHEAKTTVCCNLAVSLGYSGKKVAVVEVDFRRPVAHRLFNADAENGISEYILGKSSVDDIIKKTEYENVNIVTRGGKIDNPALVFTSDKFKALIEDLRQRFDYVLFDCAPILQISDYIHLSKVSDGVILLVAYATTSKYAVADAVNELKKNNVKLLGTVFTMYDGKKGDDNYKYYGKYYKKYDKGEAD